MKKTAIAAALILISLTAGAGTKETGEWRSKMNSLSQALAETVPFLYPDPSQDPKKLNEKVKRLHEITKTLDGSLSHGMKAPDDDPALPFIASQLRQDFERAYQSVQDGHSEYAKGIVRNSVAYCIACHTRAPGGNQFPLIKAMQPALARASWVEKVEYEAASRQFDAVLSDVKEQLTKKDSAVNAMDLERAARVALAIAIRVKNDPAAAAGLAKALEASPASTYAMKEAGKSWAKDIQEWKSEAAADYSSDGALMAGARGLIEKAQKAEGPIGGHSEVRYLRASLLMHELLKKYPRSKSSAEAMYIIGLSYDALRELGLWSLHEMYYLACIDKAPASAQAQACFNRYDQSVTLGFSGSGGTHIPPEVRKHLAQVRAKAFGKGGK
jgi:hypothetical protein